jgi:hypothetical protein
MRWSKRLSDKVTKEDDCHNLGMKKDMKAAIMKFISSPPNPSKYITLHKVVITDHTKYSQGLEN